MYFQNPEREYEALASEPPEHRHRKPRIYFLGVYYALRSRDTVVSRVQTKSDLNGPAH